MWRWGVDTPLDVSVEALNNALSPWDAVVDASVSSADGALYGEVDEALADGHRNIFVRPGAYAGGFTITGPMDDVSVFCPVVPRASGTTIVSGARFARKIDIMAGANNAKLTNLGVHTTIDGEHGFDVDGSIWTELDHCVTAGVGNGGASGYGFALYDNYYLTLKQCKALYSVDAGFIYTNGGTSPARNNKMFDCQTYQNGGPGYLIGSSAETQMDIKEYSIRDCYADGDCQSWGSGAFSIGPRNRSVSLVGCHARGAVSGAAGFYFAAAAGVGNLAHVNGCTAHGNNGGGFKRQAGFAGTMSMTGNVSYGNSGLNYDNCGTAVGFSTNA